jgi:hypothetical protein
MTQLAGTLPGGTTADGSHARTAVAGLPAVQALPQLVYMPVSLLDWLVLETSIGGAQPHCICES